VRSPLIVILERVACVTINRQFVRSSLLQNMREDMYAERRRHIFRMLAANILYQAWKPSALLRRYIFKAVPKFLFKSHQHAATGNDDESFFHGFPQFRGTYSAKTKRRTGSSCHTAMRTRWHQSTTCS
jgi:hypothetical protein